MTTAVVSRPPQMTTNNSAAKETESIWILDFGSQFTQLIARRVRELGVFSRVVPCTVPYADIDWSTARGIILSGGPSSADAPGAPDCDPRILKSGVPILGVCYGLQLWGKHHGGKLEQSTAREYGRARFSRIGDNPLFKNVPESFDVWMSHGDVLATVPEGMSNSGRTDSVEIAALADPDNKFWGIQFHPEVEHTQHGREIYRAFVFDICGCKGGWNAGTFVDQAISEVREQVGDGRVLMGVSGGVDSAVLAVLLQRAIGERSAPMFVDTGLLRDDEVNEVKVALAEAGVHVDVVAAQDRFLTALEGISDPEQKRKTIGRVFIEVFEEEAKKLGKVDFLAQGTLYPDWIESVSVNGPSAVIKSHHNVGGLPEKMRLKLVEPLKWLFKDEVRAAGRSLGLPENVIGRHPFPGPGLAVRIIGPVTRPALDILRVADRIFIGELRQSGYYDKVWQAFCVLLPVKTVGVMGDGRTYENVLSLRAVVSIDGMTADWAELPHELLARVSSRIINEVRGINRVVYDISSKPPATIEWE